MFSIFKFQIKKFCRQHLAAHVVLYRLCRPVIIRHRTSVSSERLIATDFKEKLENCLEQKIPGSEVGHVSLREYVEPLAEIITDAQCIVETIKHIIKLTFKTASSYMVQRQNCTYNLKCLFPFLIRYMSTFCITLDTGRPNIFFLSSSVYTSKIKRTVLEDPVNGSEDPDKLQYNSNNTNNDPIPSPEETRIFLDVKFGGDILHCRLDGQVNVVIVGLRLHTYKPSYCTFLRHKENVSQDFYR
jgi:hypothetical protein